MPELSLPIESGFKSDFRYEEIQFFFRKHWTQFLRIIFFGLLIGFLVFMVLSGLYGLVLFFRITALRFFFVFVALISVFFYFMLFFLELISYYFDIVIVTDHRIILVQKTVFLKNDSAAIDLTKVQDFTAESRGIFRNYLGYGKILITLSASIPPVVLEQVPKPHDYLERANRVKREHILKRQERRFKAPGELKEAEEKPIEYLQDIHALLKSAP